MTTAPWRLDVAHITQFQYESEVTASFNEARMTPLHTEGQTLISHAFRVNPHAAIYEYSDYFGTTVQSFDVQSPHTFLNISSRSIVDTNIPFSNGRAVSWHELERASKDLGLAEYLTYSPLVNEFDHKVDLRGEKNPRSAIDYLNSIMREKIAYTTGATHVYTPASEAWDKGAGVCQDFSHASLSILRSAGIPARYVSGYLYTGTGEIGETVIGESHSWVDAWVGYWIQFDPTNGREVAQDHILVAKGRDYHDVSPLKGIFSGGRSRKIEVEVSITRIAR